MKNNNNHQYAGINSFDDFKAEKQRLMMKRIVIEARLNQRFLHLKNVFSISSLVFSMAKELIMPKISSFLGSIIQKVSK